MILPPVLAKVHRVEYLVGLVVHLHTEKSLGRPVVVLFSLCLGTNAARKKEQTPKKRDEAHAARSDMGTFPLSADVKMLSSYTLSL